MKTGEIRQFKDGCLGELGSHMLGVNLDAYNVRFLCNKSSFMYDNNLKRFAFSKQFLDDTIKIVDHINELDDLIEIDINPRVVDEYVLEIQSRHS